MSDTTDPLDVTRAAAAEQAISIGPYRLLQRIGEGGMGDVWLAEQIEPIKRRVALKVIKPGMDSRQVIARFEAERQALAVMDHPNVATVFDAGTTALGRPYFAMEYVKGESITTFADRAALSIHERLALFLQVCDGVQHAHQKGIIHRDLKPSNILVAPRDGRPVPIIIDFGVAKATTMSLTDRTIYTELGSLIGTLEYMSPEQAQVTAADVDTRADVYSLGVILYELLTGTLPFDRRTLRDSGFEEAQRTIQTINPARPSTRIVSADVAKTRATDPPQLIKYLRGDLDWIILKCLEKDRARRYATVSELAADIQRYLSDEPVLASPPSTLYRIRKFTQRHRPAVAMVASFAVALTVLIAMLIVQGQRVRLERDRATKEADASKRVSDFLVGLFQVADPSETRGNTLTARELLDNGARDLERSLAADPDLQARLFGTIGETYESLGMYASAKGQLERAVDTLRRTKGADDPATLRATTALAALYVRQQQYDEALRLFQAATDRQRQILGPDHPDYLRSLQDLGWLIARKGQHAEGEKLVREALDRERRILGSDHPDTLRGLGHLSNVMSWEGRLEEQEAAARERWERLVRVKGSDHPDTLSAERILASSLTGRKDRLAEEEKLQRDTLGITRRVLGSNHPNTGAALNDLGLTLRAKGDSREAEQVLQEAVRINAAALGPEADSTLLAMNNLGLVYMDARLNAEAGRLYSDLLERSRRIRGAEHQRTLMVMNNLGFIYARERRFAQAEPLIRSALDISRRTNGARHRLTVAITVTLAEVMAMQRRADEAMAAIGEAVAQGYDVKQLADDEDLAPLRADPRFARLIAGPR